MPTMRRRRSTGRETPGDRHGDLEAELMVLREDNARLRAAQHRPADLGSLVAAVRALPVAIAGADGDEAAQALVDSLLLRDALQDVSDELARSLAAVEDRLRALAAPGPPSPDDDRAIAPSAARRAGDVAVVADDRTTAPASALAA